MNMTATNVLKAKMVECGVTQKVIAEALGISHQGLQNKLNNKTEFKASEIKTISKMLGIEKNKDIYFFAD